ncbi:TlpA family protein disulfide reductase [Pedobacter westerhofensis]|nr:hypothetical protein [Pedobacter westerhofensis]
MNNASAQEHLMGKPILTGKIQYTKKNLPDSIMITVVSKLNYWEPADRNIIKMNVNHEFSFEFNKANKLILFKPVAIRNTGVNGSGEAKSWGTYYAEPTDKVHIDIFDRQIESLYGAKEDSLRFSGMGAEKYNLIFSLNRIFYHYFSLIPKEPGQNLDSLDSFLHNFNQLRKQYINKIETTINSSSKTSSQIHKLLTYSYSTQFNLLWASYHELAYKKCSGFHNLQKRIIENFNQYESEVIDVKVEDIVLYNPHYFQWISSIIKTKEFLNNEGNIDLAGFYKAITNTYSQKIRERMIIELFMGTYGTERLSNIYEVSDSLLADARKYLQSRIGRLIISEKMKFKKGAPLYNGEFITLDDKKFTTASLKGKVFLLEMWGVGCTACAGYHAKFEQELWPILKNKKDFKMLSINDGKTKDWWLRGIDSKLYTSKDYINVSNLPYSSFNHPFFKYYAVYGAPFMLLVDKEGKIVAQIKTDIQSKELLALIDNALSEKHSYSK